MNGKQYRSHRATWRLKVALFTVIAAAALPGIGGDVETLIKNIQSEDAEVRIESADKAAEAGVDALVPLAGLLDHHDQFVVKDVQHAMMNIVHHAGRPGAEGGAEKAEQALIKIIEVGGSTPARIEALELLHFVGTEDAVEAVAACLEKEELFEAALRCLEEIPDDDAGEALIDALQDADAARQIRLLQSLGHRGSSEDFEELTEDLNTVLPAARIAALDALSRMGVSLEGKYALPLGALFSEKELRQLPDIMLRIADVEAKAGNKTEALHMYQSLLDGAVLEHVVCGALIGISKLNDPDTLGLFGEKMADPSAAVRAIASDVIIQWKGSDVDGMLKKRYSEAQGEEQAALLRALSKRAVSGVDGILREAVKSDNLSTRVTALEILGDSAGTDLEAAYLENSRADDARVAKAARDGYLKMADRVLAEGKTDHALKMLHQALEFVDDGDVLRRALTAIGGVGSESSVPLVKDLIDRGIVPHDAANAYLTLGEAFAKGGDAQRQNDMIMEMIDHPNAGPAKNIALDQFKALGNDSSIFTKRQGFVNKWHLVGPFPNANGEAFGKAYFPEEKVDLAAGGEFNGEKFEWKAMSTEAIPARISMSEYFEKNQFVTSYAYAELNAPEAMEVQFLMGTNDGCEFWVNGEKLFEVNMPRGCEVDGDKIPAKLKAGKNEVLLKVLQEGGGWEYCVRLADKDGNPIDLTQVKLLD